MCPIQCRGCGKEGILRGEVAMFEGYLFTLFIYYFSFFKFIVTVH